MPMMTKKILDIQFLRGIAIILVMISHLSYIQDNWIASYRIFPGWIGVDLFFVISGFVVIRSFEGIDFDTRAFVLRRIFRIYPAIIVILLFCLITNLILPLISNEAALSVFHIPETRLLKQSFAILTGTFPDQAGMAYVNGPFWSLSCEFKFYAVIALATLILRSLGYSKNLIKNFLLASACTFYLVILAGRALSYFAISLPLMHYLIVLRYDLFALGLFAGLLPRAWISYLCRLTQSGWLMFLIIPLILVSQSRNPNYPADYGDKLESLVMPFTGICFVALVIIASRGQILKSIPGRMSSLIDWIGDRSFVLYILHFPSYMVAWYLLHFYRTKFKHRAPLVGFAALCICCYPDSREYFAAPLCGVAKHTDGSQLRETV